MNGTDVKVLRLRAGITAEELASRLGVHPSAMVDLELDRIPIARSMERRIRQACSEEQTQGVA